MKSISFIDCIKMYILKKRVENDSIVHLSGDIIITNENLIEDNKPVVFHQLNNGVVILSITNLYREYNSSGYPLDLYLMKLYNQLEYTIVLHESTVGN